MKETNQQLLVTVYPNPFTVAIEDTAWKKVALTQALMNMERPVLVQAPVAKNEDVDMVMDDDKEAQEELAMAVVNLLGTLELPRFNTFLQADFVIKAMTTHVVFCKTQRGYLSHPGNHQSGRRSKCGYRCQAGTSSFPLLLPMECGRVLVATCSVPTLKQSQKSIDQTRDGLFHGFFPVFFLGPMDGPSRRVSTSFKINNHYVYSVNNCGYTILDKDFSKLKAFLTEIKTDAAIAYAGSMSITFVSIIPERGVEFRPIHGAPHD